jgi:leucine-zipper-like transcriptional regulator 1
MPPPPPSAQALQNTGSSSSSSSSLLPSTSTVWGWSKIEPDPGGQPAPCQRSLHVATVLGDKMYIFGGYDGSNRVNDFYEFDITSRKWSLVPSSGTPPSPRDRHTGVVHSTNFYVFAGFDGAQRVNDFFCFSFSTSKWSPVQVSKNMFNSCLLYVYVCPS